MIDKIVRKMTKEQKQMLLDAPNKKIICKTGGNRKGLFRGLVNVATGKNVSVTVARTELVFNDDAEAIDVMEKVVQTVFDEAAGSKSEPEPKKKPSKKKKAPSPKDDKWKFYRDAKGEWRWRHTVPNGEIVGAATEGYENLTGCEDNARRNGWAEPKKDTNKDKS